MLSTIGYEGASPDEFIQTLQVTNVSVLIDVRERAQSRRAGFSKSALQDRLLSAGIRYIHLRELGDPPEGRAAARADDIQKFKRIFASVLATDAAKIAVERIVAESQTEHVCLLCYERDPAHCHRTLISDKIETLTGKKARHLGVKRFEQAKQLG